jgi:hypothetical protein
MGLPELQQLVRPQRNQLVPQQKLIHTSHQHSFIPHGVT